MSTAMTLPARFLGLDVHKASVVVGAANAQQQIVLPVRRLSLTDFEPWARQQLLPSDSVVLEASINAWAFYDLLEPLVASVTIAHPLLVQLIAAARVKTDGRDALHLARLLATNMIPAVWVPPQPVRELRMLLAHRRRLIEQRTQARNRLQSVLHWHNILPLEGLLFTAGQRAWWSTLGVGPSEALHLRHDLAQLDYLETLITEVEAALAHLSTTDPWVTSLPFLLQVPGVGLLTAMTVLAAIGEITRFPSAKKLVGYSDLGGSVAASGQTYRTGGITKQGRRELRTALVEAAWIAVQHYPPWKARFERLTARMGKRKAIVAIARKLLVVIWHVLTEQVADREADMPAVARKFMKWAEGYHTATHLGLGRAQFARQQLAHLGLGIELGTFSYKGRIYAPLQTEGGGATT